MAYVEYAVVGVAFLIFLFVVGAVLLGLAIKLLAGGKKKPSGAAVVYPIPPAEKGTGQHVSLLDLVDAHVAAEDTARRRKQVSDKLYDWMQPPAPKA